MGSLSGYYTSVQKILSRITSNTMKSFSEQKSDRDRVAFILSQEFIEDAFKIEATLSNKSVADSKKLREAGNKCFQNKQYKEALEFYTKSVISAKVSVPNGEESDSTEMDQESQNSDEFLLALGNRSTTLYQMERYEECLVDIEVALKFRYPEHLLYKLYDRKARCHLSLGQHSLARESFQEVKRTLNGAKLDETKKESIVSNTEIQIQSLNKQDISENAKVKTDDKKTNRGQANPRCAFHDEVPVLPEVNARYPCASPAFDVRYSSDKGRYVVAARNIDVGDLLVVERPYVSVLDHKTLENRCYHCHTRVHIPYACFTCTRVQYCSETCREVSWNKYHRVECPFLPLLINSGTGTIAQLAMRVLLFTGYRRVVRYKKNPKSDQRDVQTSLFTDSKGVYMGGYMGLYSLVSHSNQRPSSDLLQYTVLAIFLLKILEKADYISVNVNDDSSRGTDESFEEKRAWYFDDELVTIGGILLRFLQIITCNGIESVEMKLAQSLQKCSMEPVGLGLYPTVSLFNHACDPNVDLVFFDDVVTVRALRSVKAGRELNMDYGVLYHNRSRSQRQLSLRSQYFFDCRCIACVNSWGLKAELKSDIPLLKCVHCEKPLAVGLFAQENGADPARHQCRRCGTVQNPLEMYERLQKSAGLFDRSLDQARMFDVDGATPKLESYLRLLDKTVSQPWKDYASCIDMLRLCYKISGNRDRSRNIFREC